MTLSDAALIQAVRNGRAELFGHVYRRHYAAVQAYASQCMPDPLHAHELTSYVFTQLLQRMLAGEPFVGLRHLGCLRRQLLDSVRATAIRRREYAPLSPAFRDWVEGGCQWPWDEDVQLGIAFPRLPTATQCLLWHCVVDRDDLALTARITGLSRNAVQGKCRQAKGMLRQARTDLYLERLGRQNCAEVIKQLALRPEAPPAQEITAHLRDCPACLGVYKDLTRLDSRMEAQLPVRLLGWWPGESYLSAKATIPVPLDDPPFLARLMERGRSRTAAQPPGARRGMAATTAGGRRSCGVVPSHVRSPRTSGAVVGFLAGVVVGLGTLAACDRQGEIVPRPPQEGVSRESDNHSFVSGETMRP
ncbi:sigma-70 family RNA polymerase sigma factor [Streptomyces piniterrae]|uniref:Sigma-70 family RNA polymerase sigma factor n=1 Tax=Streptomyces piniterrae TaxID=2571125 RepID=A0A4U0N6L7_9ACTN|nr:sigma-70 family RNA polymerase sigma factor [Streptomyces piniterrae]TJZ49447.1 sigma-70 family RNA polymerase sigma factor [Streptomyces piniterrae]